MTIQLLKTFEPLLWSKRLKKTSLPARGSPGGLMIMVTAIVIASDWLIE